MFITVIFTAEEWYSFLIAQEMAFRRGGEDNNKIIITPTKHKEGVYQLDTTYNTFMGFTR